MDMNIIARTRSISDDDLCATCRHLDYRPGELSVCKHPSFEPDWEAQSDEDGYVQRCPEHREVSDLDRENAKAVMAQLQDTPVNHEMQLLEPFLHFPRGTQAEDIWQWIEREYGVPIHELIYRRGGAEALDRFSSRD